MGLRAGPSEGKESTPYKGKGAGPVSQREPPVPHPAAQPPAYAGATLDSQYGQETWSCWHRVEVPGIGVHGEELSLQELLDQLQRVHGLPVRTVLCGVTILYASFWGKQKREAQLTRRLTQLVSGPPGAAWRPPRILILDLVCEDQQDDDVLPPVHVRLPCG